MCFSCEHFTGDNSWMKHLNSGVENSSHPHHIALEHNKPWTPQNRQLIIEFNDESGEYTYPNEDFCHFRHFPHARHVFPLINTRAKLNCTCTLLWLIQHLNGSEKALDTVAVRPCLRHGSFRQNLAACRFEQRIRECARSSQRIFYGVNSSSRKRAISRFSVALSITVSIMLAIF